MKHKILFWIISFMASNNDLELIDCTEAIKWLRKIYFMRSQLDIQAAIILIL